MSANNDPSNRLWGQMLQQGLAPRRDDPDDGVDHLRRCFLDKCAGLVDLPSLAGALVPPFRPNHLSGLPAVHADVRLRQCGDILLQLADLNRQAQESDQPRSADSATTKVSFGPEVRTGFLEWFQRHKPVLQALRKARVKVRAEPNKSKPQSAVRTVNLVEATLPFLLLFGAPPVRRGDNILTSVYERMVDKAEPARQGRNEAPRQRATLFGSYLFGVRDGIRAGDNDRITARQELEVLRRSCEPGETASMLAQLYLNLVHAHLGIGWPPNGKRLECQARVFKLMRDRCAQVLRQVVRTEPELPLADMAASLHASLMALPWRTDGRTTLAGDVRDLPAPFQPVGNADVATLCDAARRALREVSGAQQQLALAIELARDTASHLSAALQAAALGMLDGNKPDVFAIWTYQQRLKARICQLPPGQTTIAVADIALRIDRVQRHYSFIERAAPAILSVAPAAPQGASQPAPRSTLLRNLAP
jgi:hypothetical protein